MTQKVSMQISIKTFVKNSIIAFSLASIVFLYFTSCTPRIDIEVHENSLVDISFASALEAHVEPQIRSLMGISSTTALFEKKAIQESLESAGFQVSSISLPTPISVDIATKKQNLNAEKNPLANLIKIETQDSKTILHINLEPENMQRLIQTMPPEVQEYTELLMAPALTGEMMDANEYIGLFALVYGQSLSTAFESSPVYIRVQTPKPITHFELSNKNLASIQVEKNKAIISLSLYKLLSLNTKTKNIDEQKITIQIEWNN